ADCLQFHDQLFIPQVHYQIWIAFSDVMLLVFQLNHFLAFVSDLGESKPDLHSTVIHILRKSRTQGLVNIFSNFSNHGCLVGHSRLPCGWSHFIAGQRRSISFMISSAQRIASEMAATVAGTRLPPSCWASFRAARIAAIIPSTRLRP